MPDRLERLNPRPTLAEQYQTPEREAFTQDFATVGRMFGELLGMDVQEPTQDELNHLAVTAFTLLGSLLGAGAGVGVGKGTAAAARFALRGGRGPGAVARSMAQQGVTGAKSIGEGSLTRAIAASGITAGGAGLIADPINREFPNPFDEPTLSEVGAGSVPAAYVAFSRLNDALLANPRLRNFALGGPAAAGFLATLATAGAVAGGAAGRAVGQGLVAASDLSANIPQQNKSIDERLKRLGVGNEGLGSSGRGSNNTP